MTADDTSWILTEFSSQRGTLKCMMEDDTHMVVSKIYEATLCMLIHNLSEDAT